MVLYKYIDSLKINKLIKFIAAWKIIKNWLPPQALKLIKFVDKKSIREHVHESQLFVHMGGTVMIYYLIFLIYREFDFEVL